MVVSDDPVALPTYRSAVCKVTARKDMNSFGHRSRRASEGSGDLRLRVRLLWMSELVLRLRVRLLWLVELVFAARRLLWLVELVLRLRVRLLCCRPGLQARRQRGTLFFACASGSMDGRPGLFFACASGSYGWSSWPILRLRVRLYGWASWPVLRCASGSCAYNLVFGCLVNF